MAKRAADTVHTDSGYTVRPATGRFDDVAAVIGPVKKPDAPICWCLTYRVPSKQNKELTGPQRREMVRDLCDRDRGPGVLAYDADGTVVGWAGVAPRSELYAFREGSRIPVLDDQPVWTIWCIKTRGGHRGKGVGSALVEGGIAFARASGAPVLEAYPVDNGTEKVDTTMAYVGTRHMFQKAGFRKAADTASVLNGFPRILMRLEL